MRQLKISVLQRTFNRDIAEEYGAEAFRSSPEFGPCPYFRDHQTFIVEGLRIPTGFCSRAWADIYGEVATVAMGGGQDFVHRPGSALSCCTDGIRPVIFRIESIASRTA